MLVRLAGKMGMAEFIAPLPSDDLSIIDGRHQVIRGTSEMLADRAFIVHNHGNLHLSTLAAQI
jgi:hypothetical protein